jgi:prepilin-type N-terminal cleavage/methylation domain-containing protein
MKILNKKQSGFTLVELVVVVAVIGVLAVIAAPKIVGVASDARDASLAAVASSMTAAMARNYAASEVSTGGFAVIGNCNQVGQVMSGEVMPNGYTVSSAGAVSGDASVGFGKQKKCYVYTDDSQSDVHIFFAIGTDAATI